MAVTFIGVRHHSPACARLVAGTIDRLRPVHVLVEGPADMNDRVDELLLGHDLPVAVFSGYRDAERHAGSWAPFCAYSPEWVALRAGRDAGAQVRFIDLPAWHEALADRENRYADAEQRYADVVERLCVAFAVDNVDTLWDHLFEIESTGEAPDGLAERLAAYFDLLRGESAASRGDETREAYMARWIRAAAADAGDRPVVVVTGGFHRPALIRLTAGAQDAKAADGGGGAGGGGDAGWPAVPSLPDGATGGSYLVPYSFRRLDAFDGYQSGMPSPEYYQRLWDAGPQRAADDLVQAVVGRLRERRQRASTADLVAARAAAAGLALVRGHRHPGRADVLDGLAAALVHDALDEPLPWATRGRLRAGTHPVVVEMVAALSGDRVGRLHPDTPLPPLVHHAVAELEREGLTPGGAEPHGAGRRGAGGGGTVAIALTSADGLRRSRLLHRLRVLGIPGFQRLRGPSTGIDPVLEEEWAVADHEHRLVALIEAGGYGATLEEAATAVLAERLTTGRGDTERLAGALFDAALCGTDQVSERVLRDLDQAVAAAAQLDGVGRLLAVVLALWRHDGLLGTAGSAALAAVVAAAHQRVLWLAEGVRGGSAPAEPARIDALVAARDATVHAGRALGLDREAALAVMDRIAADREAPPDLRGAAFGFAWSVAGAADPERTVRGAGGPAVAGDWLAGLFALAREEVLHADGVLAVLDELVSGLGDDDFLVALPSLRQAFAYFPPREREVLATRLLERRGLGGTGVPGRALLRVGADPQRIAAAAALEARVDAALAREGLL
ncbi:DUF5682 family protein [Dactylosporangium sucinum]|uniref:Uncharacterized protein n=1 Tax=Dactylosporangium sucinum TaxID=1424081 RepID=A0A917T2V4_9ACTN|nr:DUF5682 family protein [Dactylosporangium sucinum]GGM08911.1 hypothetical protein GCM10007977_007560 [Dactylosporangium sucinum]